MIDRSRSRCTQHVFVTDLAYSWDCDPDQASSSEVAVTCTGCGVHDRRCPCRRCRYWGPLSPREAELARMICDGLTRREVARRMEISPRTFDSHRAHVLAKLGLASEVQLARLAVSEGWVQVRWSPGDAWPGDEDRSCAVAVQGASAVQPQEDS